MGSRYPQWGFEKLPWIPGILGSHVHMPRAVWILRPERVLSTQLWWTEVLQNQKAKFKRDANYLCVEGMLQHDAETVPWKRLEVYWLKASNEICLITKVNWAETSVATREKDRDIIELIQQSLSKETRNPGEEEESDFQNCRVIV